MSDRTTAQPAILGNPFPLDMHWPTVDPFLFCAHHHDRYPSGGPGLGVDPSRLGGRRLGADFSGLDGWSMYHGTTVPGFPQHPHRGFETVSFLRAGYVDHSDSLGATARFGPGDVQWMSAGAGVQHAEMFPLLGTEGEANELEMFQIWVNLPRSAKMAQPAFEMLWAEAIPLVDVADGAQVLVLAGSFDGHTPPSPPPNSWADDPANDVNIWHIDLTGEARVELPPAASGSQRTVYVYEGDGVTIDGSALNAGHGAATDPTRALTVTGARDARLMLLQGRPIAEPVAQYGPFVMNETAEVQQAFADYQNTQFGGWPWPVPDPHHPADAGRFARMPDGTDCRPPAARA